MRNFLIGVLVFWMVVVGLIIKDEGRQAAKPGAAVDSSRVEVVFWHAMGGPLGAVIEPLIKEFNDSQTTYSIKSVNMGSYDTLQKKLLASLVAKEAPDLSQNYESLTKKFIKHRKIICLDDLLASETEDIKADIIPVLLENNLYDGKLWSFPFNKSVPVLYYNKDLFKKAGLDPEIPPRTLDELASFARKLTVRDADGKILVRGFATGKANVWMFLNRVLQMGGKVIGPDGGAAFFDQPEAARALSFLQDMLREGIAEEAQGFEHQNNFKAETAAMIENSIVTKVFMEPGIKFNLGIAPLPGQATNAVILSGSNINIFNNGDPRKIQGAWEFVKWFTSTENGARWSLGTTYMPVRKSSLKCPLFLAAMEKDPNLRAPYIQLEYSHFEPRLTCWFEIRDLIADYLERATLEMGPPETYFSKMNKEINGILSHALD
jgi:multiple sugar transport system substrate-binding protein